MSDEREAMTKIAAGAAMAFILLLWVVGATNRSRTGSASPPTIITTSTSTTYPGTELLAPYGPNSNPSIVTFCRFGHRIFDGYQWGAVVPNDPSCPQGDDQ